MAVTGKGRRRNTNARIMCVYILNDIKAQKPFHLKRSTTIDPKTTNFHPTQPNTEIHGGDELNKHPSRISCVIASTFRVLGTTPVPGTPGFVIRGYLQQLGVLPADLLQQRGQQGGVLLDQLPHRVELWLVSEEAQGVGRSYAKQI